MPGASRASSETWGTPPFPTIVTASERKSQAELDLTLGEGRGESQRYARRSGSTTGKRSARSNPMHVEGREPRLKPKSGLTSLFTLAKFVRFAMLNPSAVNCRFDLLAQFMSPRQSHVKVNIIGTETGVARGSDGTFVGGVIVAVYFSSGEQVERMSAVEPRRSGPARNQTAYFVSRGCRILPRSPLIPLIKLGKSTI